MRRSIVAIVATSLLLASSTLPVNAMGRSSAFYKPVFHAPEHAVSHHGPVVSHHLSNAQLRRIVLIQHLIIRKLIWHVVCKPHGHGHAYGWSKGVGNPHSFCPVSFN